MTGFWGLNVGLMGMIAITLVPVGVMQALESFRHGFWAARSMEFYRQPVVHLLLWLRIMPDMIFLSAGILPLVAAACYGFLNLRRAARPGQSAIEQPEAAAGELTGQPR